MKDEFPNGPFVINGENLTPVALVALARGGPRTIALTESAWERVAVGRAIVDAAIAGREVHYGINTGVGSEKGRRVDPAEFATFNRRIIIGEATNMPGSNFEAGIVRGALVVLANNAATGRLGVRPALVERLLALFAAPALPLVRSGTSGGMADLSPLAQLSLAVIGEDRPHSIESPAERFDLAAKEAVSLINCNAFLLSHAAIVLETSTQLAEAFDLATAFSLEGFRGNLNYLRKGFGPNLGNPWQIKSASRIADALDGSALWSPAEWRNLHDPLSFRCAQRVNGALRAAIGFASTSVEDDLNTVCDNPVVSLEESELVTGVNMDSTPLTAAIDMLRQTLTMAASVSTERALKQQNAGFSGLPVGLSSSTGAGGGMGALMIAYFATARQTAMRGLAAPVLLDSGHAVADGIEDVAGSGPLSVQRTAEVAELCWQIVTVEILTALWALSLRDIHPNSIGAQLRPLAAKILPRLPIGREGESVFDLTPLVEIVRKTISTQGSTHAV